MFLRTFLPFCLLASLVVAEPLTPETATRLALEKNPRLAAARAVIAEAEARASGLGRLPNPELETEFAAGTRDRGRIEIGLTQTFPRTARLRLERRVAAESINLARREIAVAEIATVARVRTALVDLAAAEAALALAERQAALAREQASAWRAQSDAGQLSALDASHAELVARERELALAEPRAARLTAAATLATELGLTLAELPTVSLDLALPSSPPAPFALGPRADLARSEAALAAGDAEIALARTQGREDWRLGVFVEGEQDRDDFGSSQREAKLGLRFSVPLPVRNVAAQAVAEKQAARRRLTLERDALLASARNDLDLAASDLTTRHRAARILAEELLPAARAHLAAVESSRARGEAELSQVYLARERLSELERAELAARHAYHLAHVRRLAASGLLLP